MADKDGKAIFDDCLSHFVKSGDRRWWWEDFRQPSFSFHGLERAFEYLNEVIPDLEQNVWLIVEDDTEPFYPVYDARPAVISAIIGNCFGFEYYIIDKHKKWLLCENHHNRLIGVGDELRKHNSDLLSSNLP